MASFLLSFWNRIDRALDVVFRRNLESRLLRALKRGDLSCLEQYLDGGGWPIDQALTPHPKALNGMERTRLINSGHTLLHRASEQGQGAAVASLLARGADPNARTGAGVVPLHFAAWGGHGRIMAALAARGGDLATPLPSFSNFCWEEAYVGPNAAQIFQQTAGRPFESEQARNLAQDLETSIPEAAPAALPARRSRL